MSSISLKILVTFGIFFLSSALLCGTGLSQETFADYIDKGYTKEEMDRLEQCSTILSLARVCGLDTEKEMNGVFNWIRRKEHAGLPDLGMIFLDHMGSVSFDVKEKRLRTYP